jgi:potassium-transporting ATPase KdpC subunit
MREFTRAILIFVTMTVLLGLAYPFAMTGISQLFFREKAKGSLVVSDNRVIGSSMIGQNFSHPKYFHGRPSALEKAYDASNSGGSNFGPSNAKFLEKVGQRIDVVRKENTLDPGAPVPADLVLASASGLDPHISVETAMLQVPRVAKAQGLAESEVEDIVAKHVESPLFGFLGSKRINVLRLNMSLDELSRRNSQAIVYESGRRG